MGAYLDLQRFITSHKDCAGRVGIELPEPPTASGYPLVARCACGAALRQWVSPASAIHDLVFSTLLASPN